MSNDKCPNCGYENEESREAIQQIREALNLPDDAAIDEIVYRIQELMEPPQPD